MKDPQTPAGAAPVSWYLDPLVALQKRDEFQRLMARGDRPAGRGTILKTDLFEEANGGDQLLFGSFSEASMIVGLDILEETARRAARLDAGSEVQVVVSDVRALPFRDDSIDFVVSTSTLDHFDRPGDIEKSLRELARVLKGGGQILVVLDNPWNPMYHLLRLASRLPRFPFRLGRTLSGKGLEDCLRKCDLAVVETELVIHNPRLVSTLFFLCLRGLMGRFADQAVRESLRLFSLLRHLPSRSLTACFVAVRAEKPVNG